MSKKDLVDIIRLIRTKRVGAITFIKLIKEFGNASSAIDAIPTLSEDKIKVSSKSDAEKEIDLALSNNIEIIDYTSSLYPPLLKQIEDYPPLLFVKGYSKLLKKSSIAVIGSRNASLLGQQNAFSFAKELGEHGFLVASGMAKGIDTSAHEASLNKGTLAVLGCGVDVVYPKENKKLYDKIVDLGVVISEFPIGTKPIDHNFPKRNRIISGISRGVLVVEASKNSGSIITARLALEQGREVFAIPGNPTDSRAKGANLLIKDGAILCENVEDIISVIKKQPLIVNENTIDNFKTPPLNIKNINKQEIQEAKNYLLQILSSSPISIDNILQQNKFGYNQLSIAILELELSGKLERHQNNRISLTNTLE